MYTKWWTESSFKRARRTAAAGLCSLMLIVSGCSLLPNEKEEEVLPEIIKPQISQKPEYTVTTQTLENKVTLLGKMISLEEETLFFRLKGKHLKELYVEAGDQVVEGQVIGELDVDDMVKNLRLARLSFQSDENAMKETLRQRDEMDPTEYQQRVIAFEEKRQQLTDMEEEISKATLVAPFSGTVVSLSVSKGDTIEEYKPVAVIANTSKLVPAAKLTKTEMEKVVPGMEAQITVSGAGTIKGTVKQLPVASTDNNNNNPGGNNVKVERPQDFMQLTIGEMPEGLTRGMPVSIVIITKKTENAIVIPPSALRSIGARNYVQVVDEKGKREVDVEVGQQTPTLIEILQGLEPGQKVVGK